MHEAVKLRKQAAKASPLILFGGSVALSFTKTEFSDLFSRAAVPVLPATKIICDSCGGGFLTLIILLTYYFINP